MYNLYNLQTLCTKPLRPLRQNAQSLLNNIIFCAFHALGIACLSDAWNQRIASDGIRRQAVRNQRGALHGTRRQAICRQRKSLHETRSQTICNSHPVRYIVNATVAWSPPSGGMSSIRRRTSGRFASDATPDFVGIPSALSARCHSNSPFPVEPAIMRIESDGAARTWQQNRLIQTAFLVDTTLNCHGAMPSNLGSALV